jgi:hypothetical protein
MTGSIKIIGANNQSHLGWMEKTFENCFLDHVGENNTHLLVLPENGKIPIDIYKTWVISDKIIFEGYASIENEMGRLAFEFSPQ